MNRVAPLLALTLAACTDYQFGEQDAAFAFDQESDTLVLTINSQGLFASGPDDQFDPIRAVALNENTETTRRPERRQETRALQRAEKRIREVAAGARHIYLLAWPFVFDLDEDPKDWREEADGRADFLALIDEWEALSGSIVVADSGTYLDEQGDVGVYQRVEFREAARFVDWSNRMISRGVLETLAQDDADTGGADEAKEAFREYAASGKTWFEFNDRGLEVRVPVTPPLLAEMMKSMLSAPADSPSGASGLRLFHDLSELEIQDGVAHFRFDFGDDGRIDMPFRGSRPDTTDALRARFTDDDLETLTKEQVRERLDGDD